MSGFGSKADMCDAKGHVRFTPESGHEQQLGMSALGQKQPAANPSTNWPTTEASESVSALPP
jgi:hypothetical protein